MQSIGATSLRHLLQGGLFRMQDSPELFPFTGDLTLTHGVKTISNVRIFDLQHLAIGMNVTGTGIAPGTTIVAVDSTSAPAGPTAVILSLDMTGGPYVGDTWQASWAPAAMLQVDLFQPGSTPGPDPVVADFLLATFDGYGSLFPTTSQVSTRRDGTPVQDLGLQSWSLASTPVTGNLIAGYVVSFSPAFGQTEILMYENFGSPLPMQKGGDAVVFSLPLSFVPQSAEVIS